MHKLIEGLFFLIKNDANRDLIANVLLRYLREANEIVLKKHPLGFYSVHLGRFNDTVNLRMHIWDPILPVQSELLLIHTHIFNFKSLVLVGSIQNITYSLVENDTNTGVIYRVVYDDEKSNMY